MQYRSAAVGGIVTQFVFGFIRVMIFTAFYANANIHTGMNLSQVISYIWLGQAFLMMLPFSGDNDVNQLVRTGSVACELLRPIDLYSMWFARSLAARTAPTLLRCLPILITGLLFLGLKLPATISAAILFAVSMCLTLLLNSAYNTMMVVITVRTLSSDGPIRMSTAFVYLLCGIAIPSSLFPDALQPLLHLLPFRGMMDTPFVIYTGAVSGMAVAVLLLHQVVWTGLLVLIGRWLLMSVQRHLVVQGG